MARVHPGCPFERYADDVVIHCRRREEALEVKRAVEERLRRCELEAHPEKTRIVYCRDSNRRQHYKPNQFDFLGYGFRPRAARNRRNELFTSFSPAISTKATKAIVAEVRKWAIHRSSDWELHDLARLYNGQVRGWVVYYGRYHPSALWRTFWPLNRRLVRWAQRKYKRFRGRQRQATHWLRDLAREQPMLFAHWQIGIVP
jgi:RNA-directed DNA polymerase